MTSKRFVELVSSFTELPCGVCSESFSEGELSDFKALCFILMNTLHEREDFLKNEIC